MWRLWFVVGLVLLLTVTPVGIVLLLLIGLNNKTDSPGINLAARVIGVTALTIFIVVAAFILLLLYALRGL